jgi:23S rRNA pseudouridine2605 synthase
MNRKGNKKTSGSSSQRRSFSNKPKQRPKASQKKASDLVRLNKYIANSGVCSRREADENIALGLVSVNGKVVTEMGHKVKPGDEVRYDGRRINPEPKTYVLLNKPKGFATTTSGDKGKTVMDLVANATTARIKPVGRLGRNSTGLLLFTNDDQMMQKFTNSSKGVERLFHIGLDKNLKAEDLNKIKAGIKLGDKTLEVEDISYVQGSPKNEVGLKIKNTGNSIIRHIFESLKYDIIKIDCVAIAHLTKKDLPRGHWKHLTQQELNTLNML